MDVLTLLHLQSQLKTPSQARTLKYQMQRSGEEGLLAAERLALSPARRPAGALVWCHVPVSLEAGALVSLRERLAEELPGVAMLVTSPETGSFRAGLEAAGITAQVPPLESAHFGQRFLDHWSPDCGIWFGNTDAPLLLEAAARRGVPLFLQNAVAPTSAGSRARALHRRLLGFFDRIFALNAVEYETFRALGSLPARIEVSGALTRMSNPPGCLETERQALAEAIHGRPVWLAAFPHTSEIPALLTAHREARRAAHRLLLMLVPREDSGGREIAERLRSEGWTVARREADEDPGETTDIFVADSPEEIGLYYRLAPITFLGGTLADKEVPLAAHPAALGSALIVGPFPGGQADMLRPLRRGGACILVANSGRLGAAVTDLLSPDRAAELALAAWEITSAGSQVLDRLSAAVLPALRTGAS